MFMWISENEYSKILRTFPIPCVDLIIKNTRGEVLMLMRKNEPAKGEWWFPGGRILHGESRHQAVKRKLKEECGLIADNITEWKTLDVFLSNTTENYTTHAVSTFYLISTSEGELKLDSQSSEAMWKMPNEWEKHVKNELIKDIFKQINKTNN
jgi:colanic acid biosynthesis protein WcaH